MTEQLTFDLDRETYFNATDRLAHGEALPGGPGACTSCHHARIWHRVKSRLRPCDRCACNTFTSPARYHDRPAWLERTPDNTPGVETITPKGEVL